MVSLGMARSGGGVGGAAAAGNKVGGKGFRFH
jgi:hypothetical protein